MEKEVAPFSVNYTSFKEIHGQIAPSGLLTPHDLVYETNSISLLASRVLEDSMGNLSLSKFSFLKDCVLRLWSEDFIGKLFKQLRHYPIIKSALDLLKNDYQRWDGNENADLTRKISIQHENLLCLSEVFTQYEFAGNHGELKELTFLPIPSRKEYNNTFMRVSEVFSKWLVVYLEGRIVFNRDIVIHENLNRALDSINKMNAFLIPKTNQSENLAKLKDSLKSRCEFIWASKFSENYKYECQKGNHKNSVYYYYDPEEEKNKLFQTKSIKMFKKFSKDLSGNGPIMEYIVYKLSLINPAKDLFTKTRLTAHLMFDQDTENDSNSSANLPIYSSDQEPIQGIQLDLYLADVHQSNPLLSFQELMRGLLAAVISGSADCHLANLFVTNDFQIRLHDNSRALCHTNGIVNRGNQHFLPFRCGILEFQESLHTFTKRDLGFISNEIKAYQKCFPSVQTFFCQEEIVGLSEEFSQGWFNQKLIVHAWQERIQRASEAIKEPHVTNLFEFVCEVFPFFKIFALLEVWNRLLSAYKESDFQTEKRCILSDPLSIVGDTGSKSFENLLSPIFQNCEKHPIDFQILQEWAATLPLTTAIKKLVDAFENNHFKYSSEGFRDFKDWVLSYAIIDFKDIDKQHIVELITHLEQKMGADVELVLCNLGFTKHNGTIREINDDLKRNPNNFYYGMSVDELPLMFFLWYLDEKEKFIADSYDYSSKIGFYRSTEGDFSQEDLKIKYGSNPYQSPITPYANNPFLDIEKNNIKVLLEEKGILRCPEEKVFESLKANPLSLLYRFQADGSKLNVIIYCLKINLDSCDLVKKVIEVGLRNSSFRIGDQEFSKEQFLQIIEYTKNTIQSEYKEMARDRFIQLNFQEVAAESDDLFSMMFKNPKQIYFEFSFKPSVVTIHFIDAFRRKKNVEVGVSQLLEKKVFLGGKRMRWDEFVALALSKNL